MIEILQCQMSSRILTSANLNNDVKIQLDLLMKCEILTRFTKLVNVRFVDNKPFGFILSPAVFHVWKDHIVQRFGQTQTKRVGVHVIEPQSACIQVIDHEINASKDVKL